VKFDFLVFFLRKKTFSLRVYHPHIHAHTEKERKREKKEKKRSRRQRTRFSLFDK